MTQAPDEAQTPARVLVGAARCELGDWTSGMQLVERYLERDAPSWTYDSIGLGSYYLARHRPVSERPPRDEEQLCHWAEQKYRHFRHYFRRVVPSLHVVTAERKTSSFLDKAGIVRHVGLMTPRSMWTIAADFEQTMSRLH